MFWSDWHTSFTWATEDDDMNFNGTPMNQLYYWRSSPLVEVGSVSADWTPIDWYISAIFFKSYVTEIGSLSNFWSISNKTRI